MKMEKELICLNCSHIQKIDENKVEEDRWGRYTVCEECESSFDIP
jgi:cbb3-type cytochrome oxidase cytochrome c subunit